VTNVRYLKSYSISEEEKSLPKILLEATITLRSKPQKNTIKIEKPQNSVIDKHRCKNTQKNTNKLNLAAH
jgi:hypothetical protein